MTQTIAVIRGDGIGPEIMDATLHVLDATGRSACSTSSSTPACRAYEKRGELLPAATMDSITQATASR